MEPMGWEEMALWMRERGLQSLFLLLGWRTLTLSSQAEFAICASLPLEGRD